MNVVFISHSSVVQVYQDKLRFIASTPGIELTVIVPEAYREGNSIVEAYTGNTEYRTIALPTIGGRQGKQNGFFFLRLAATLRKIQPDIIHFEEEPESLVSFQIVRTALSLKRKPKLIAFTWRNMQIPYPSLSWWHPKRIIYNLLQHSVLPHLDVMICGSQESSGYYKELGYDVPFPLIPQYGVATHVYFPRASTQEQRTTLGLSGMVVGIVGRVMRMKGIFVLADALKQLPENISLLVLGRGNDTDEFREYIKSIGIEHRVVIVQSATAEQVPEYMSMLDVLCIPSLTTPYWREQFGRVIVEAMACGVPVVGSTSGEIPFVVGTAGKIVPENNSQALRDVLHEMCTTPELRTQMRARGLERVEQHYTNQAIARSIVSVYNSVMPTR